MKLPHLDQLVPLERGEAGVLAKAVGVLLRDVTHSPEPVPLIELLSFGPLAALARKLHQRHQRELLTPPRPGRRPKPRQLRVSYDQLVALLHNRLALSYCGLSEEEALLLLGIVGKFQQQALNLARWIRFPATTS